VSLAVPVTLTVALVDTVAPAVGEVIIDVGANVSGVGRAGVLGLPVIPHPE